MKTNIILSIILSTLITFTLFSQERLGLGLEINFGINKSDLNHENEMLKDFFPNNDYPFIQSIKNSANGLYTGIGVSFKGSSFLTTFINVEFNSFQQKISHQINDSNIRINTSGSINHAFVNIQAGLRYAFNKEHRKGFFVSAVVSNKLHFNTRAAIEINYGDLRTEYYPFTANPKDNSYDKLWFVGGEFGYNFLLKETISIAPKIDYHIGLQSITANNQKPSILNIGISIKNWF